MGRSFTSLVQLGIDGYKSQLRWGLDFQIFKAPLGILKLNSEGNRVLEGPLAGEIGV